MDHQPLESSHISSCGYDPATRTLEIAFHKGHRYRYEGVPPEDHQALVTAYSPGAVFRELIRPRGGTMLKPESL